MSTKTYCDVCGRERKVTHEKFGKVYEGEISIASLFDGDVCTECYTRLDKAASAAISKEISAIRKAGNDA